MDLLKESTETIAEYLKPDFSGAEFELFSCSKEALRDDLIGIRTEHEIELKVRGTVRSVRSLACWFAVNSSLLQIASYCERPASESKGDEIILRHRKTFEKVVDSFKLFPS
jgi:hypothetical protein